MIANMIASFFTKACDTKELFDRLEIAGAPEYDRYRNQYHVVHISFNDMPRNCRSYSQYINRIENLLIKDLQREFPDVAFDAEGAVWDAFMMLYSF